MNQSKIRGVMKIEWVFFNLQSILLVVSGSEELEVSGIGGITYCLQNHVVSLLNGNESDVFHGLNKRQGLAKCSSSFVVQVAKRKLELMLLVTIKKKG